jgi:hypothetical protein
VSENDAKVPDLPDDFVMYQSQSVAGLLPDCDAAAAAVADLDAAGFGDALVLSGPEGLERLDVTGRHHGLRGRIYRFVGEWSDEHEELARAEKHLRSGGVVLRVQADEQKKAEAARILREHGSTHSVYFGRFTFEPLAD